VSGAAALSIVHPVIPCCGAALFSSEAQNFEERVMKSLAKLLIPLSLIAAAMSGCVVAPAGYYHRGYYYGPRVAVVAPAPVVVVRP
jgi:hypothetical protein